MGTSTQYTISDNLGNEQSLDAVGIVTFGPYTGTSPVEISVVGDDVNCDKYISYYQRVKHVFQQALIVHLVTVS